MIVPHNFALHWTGSSRFSPAVMGTPLAAGSRR